jgi:type IV pilus assembly protein PilC
MPKYTYTARDSSGKIKTDILEANNEQALIEKLQAQGLFIIKFYEPLEIIQSQPVLQKGVNRRFDHNNVKLEDLLIFSRQLATMLEAGVPLMRSLDVVLSQIQSRDLYNIISQIRNDVEAGKAFSQALSRHPKVFGQFWISLVEVGEASGTLADVLNKVAQHVEAEAEFRSIIISALVYPAILMFASLGAIVFFAIFVAPKFEEIFKSLKADLPLMTVLLLGTFKFVKTYLLFIIGGAIGGVFLLMNYFKTPLGKLQLEQILFKLPVFGEIMKLIIMERFAAQMAILVGSGVPILLSLDIVSRLVENESVGLLINKVREEVREGKGLADTLAKESFFPLMAVQMIKVGEETGELSKMLDHVAKYYKKNVEAFLKRFSTIFEPFMLVFMAGAIGVIVVSIFLPLFKLGQGGGYKG